MIDRPTRPERISLLDLAPRCERVEVGEGQYVEVHGVTSRAIVALVARFPQMQKLAFGMKLTPAEAVDLPAAMAATIAAGCGHAGDPEWEDHADRLNSDLQLALLEAIFRVTKPGREGFGPFVQRVRALVALIDGATGKDPAPISPTSSETPTATRTSGT